MKKIIKAVCTLGLSCMLVFGLTGCASWSRFCTDLKSDVWDKLFYSKILFYQNQPLYLKNSIIKTH